MQTDTIIGIIIGMIGVAIGILASYYFYRRSLRVKEPTWAIRTTNIIQGYSSKFNDLQVIYKGENIENLTVSRIIFWNEGAETIDRQDILTANQVRIVALEGIKLLDVKLLASNNPSSQFSVQHAADKGCAYFNFDYLDQKQGAVVQVVHNGISSKDVDVTGDIKGVRTLRRKIAYTESPSVRLGIGSRKLYFFAMGLGLTYLAVAFASLFIPSLARLLNSSGPEFSWFPVTSLIIMGAILLAMGFYSWRKLNIAPKGLEVFDEREL